jgi:hypothetical protein
MNDTTSEQELVTALKRMAQCTEVPPGDPLSEDKLLAAFDAWRTRPPAPARSSRYLMAATALAAAAAIVWVFARVPPRGQEPAAPVGTVAELPSRPVTVPEPVVVAPREAAIRARTPRGRTRPRASSASTVRPAEFVAWPGATGLPTFESGYLMRVDMPASVVVSLGLVKHLPHAAFLRTDVLVGQDQLPRAVRLVP